MHCKYIHLSSYAPSRWYNWTFGAKYVTSSDSLMVNRSISSKNMSFYLDWSNVQIDMCFVYNIFQCLDYFAIMHFSYEACLYNVGSCYCLLIDINIMTIQENFIAILKYINFFFESLSLSIFLFYYKKYNPDFTNTVGY